MTQTINMQDMRYINLFRKISGISTRFCFIYNETIFFCVPRPLIPKAIGENGSNVKKLFEILNKRVKIISMPSNIHDARNFIWNIVSPFTFKSLEIKDNELILNAGIQNKAALIGRNKKRLLEMQRIVKDFFNKEFRIV